MVNFKTSTRKQVAEYCTFHGIAVLGNKKNKKSFVEAVENNYSFWNIICDVKKMVNQKEIDSIINYHQNSHTIYLYFTAHGQEIFNSEINYSNFLGLQRNLSNLFYDGKLNCPGLTIQETEAYTCLAIAGDLPKEIWGEILIWVDRLTSQN
ncbi:MAG: hypothetical protein ACRDBG_24780 [Waterburya sp.]